jgi:LDH2 family malate/lactate/ureidoglycolate dehydrogenase
LSNSAIKLQKDRVEAYIKEVFQKAGLSEQHSSQVAGHLVLASLRGVDSHGILRLGIYLKRLELGLVNKTAVPKVVRETAASLLIDGDNGQGIPVATKTIQLAVEKAKTSGVCIAGVKNSNHCGMMAAYSLYAAKHDLISMALTAAPANMAPWGGKERFLGTNPFCYGVPTGDEDPIIFDAATSVAARGKIAYALKNNMKIPVGWAINKEGKPTTDAQEGLEGLVLPVGGPKGYGIAFFVEVLSSIFTGANIGPNIPDLYLNFEQTQNVGHSFMLMRADLFMDLQEFKSRMDTTIREIRRQPLMEGVDRIYLPGELEFIKHAERLRDGIPVTQELLDEFEAISGKYGVDISILG